MGNPFDQLNVTFESEEHIKTSLLQFFDQKRQRFFEKGILNLSERWEYVIKKNG